MSMTAMFIYRGADGINCSPFKNCWQWKDKSDLWAWSFGILLPKIKNFTKKARFYVICISFVVLGGQGIMLVNSSKTRTGFSKCRLCLSFELNTDYSSENTFGSVVIVFLFSKSISEIGINKYDCYECCEQRNSHLCILLLSQ